jgi:hypothetical protein
MNNIEKVQPLASEIEDEDMSALLTILDNSVELKGHSPKRFKPLLIGIIS